MNTYQYQLRQFVKAVRGKIRQHSDIVASSACGLVMGVLFLTFLGSYEAKQASVTAVGQKRIVVQETIVSSVSSVSESSSSVSSQTPPVSSSVVPTTAKKVATAPKVMKPKAALVHPAAPEASSSVETQVSASSSSISSETTVSSSLSSVSSSTVSASSSSAPSPVSSFPAFDHTSFPVGRVPNWGAMRTPAEWNRSYGEMTAADFVSIPRYDMSKLTIPMASLTQSLTDENIAIITAKLFYSTRYLGQYDLDAGEGTGKHAGVDLKLARGTPIGAIAGGRVVSIEKTQTLGLHVIIEHRLQNGETYFSVYAHFDRTSVSVGQDVKPGQMVGNVGMTGNTSAPHLHLQVDRGEAGEGHSAFVEGGNAAVGMVSPITFIAKYSGGDK